MPPSHHRAVARGKRRLFMSIALFGAVFAFGGNASAELPDLLGKATPTLPPGALQVQDVEADPKGYTGTILVRGVVAVQSTSDPHLFGLIDSREARVCRDLHCAKYYLPIKVQRTDLKPWDELNVRGTMTEDPNKKSVYLNAETVENLGSIRK